jgi:hypothetical protein
MSHAGVTLEQLLPHLRPWVEGLANEFPATWVNGPKFGFASWEVGHIVSLILLGGTTILMNLRLLGAGITTERPVEIYRNLRFWQNVGVIGIVVTGILIGSANAVRLYDSTAFIVKMLALASGVILTYGVSRPVAAADGAVSLASKLWLVVGGAIFLLGMWIFGTADLIDVGVYHLITGGALLLLAATAGPTRIVYTLGMVAIIVAQWAHTHLAIKPDDYDHLNPVNKAYTAAYCVWIIGTALVTLFRGRSEAAGGPLTKTVAYATILVWVLGAAAGRWIAFA